MIQANELRIGNWVADRGLKEFKINNWESQNKVSAKYEVTMCDGILFETHPLTEYVDYLKPIPLTEEWLLKFGFRVSDRLNSFPLWHKGINEFTYDYLFSLKFDSENQVFFYQNGRFKIDYVHQLQNLYFALIGEELEINTEKDE